MPRRNRPRRGGGAAGPDLSGLTDRGVRREPYAGRTWVVRAVRGNDSGRSYVCPGCQVRLPASVAHEVVWPDDGLGGVEDRRHWHTACWSARFRRPPRGSY